MSVGVPTVITECQSEESRLHDNPGVNSVTVSDSSIDYNNLFNFDDTERYYCGPTNMKPFTMTITYSSPVSLREIGIHGYDRIFPLSNQFVTSFSLSFSKDGDNFTEYMQDTGSTVCYINSTCVVIANICRSLLCQMKDDITLHCGLPSLPLV